MKSDRLFTGEPIAIGIVLSLGEHGPSVYCQKYLNGIRIALRQINDAGGLDGHEVRVIVKDADANEDRARSAIADLITEHKVQAVIGDLISSTNSAMAPIACSKHVVLLAAGATGPRPNGPDNYVFKTWAADEFEGTILANYAKRNLAAASVAMIVQEDKKSMATATAFELEAAKNHISKINRTQFKLSPADCRPSIEELLAQPHDIVFLSADAGNTGRILRQFKDKDKGPWLSRITVSFEDSLELAGMKANDVTYVHPIFNATSQDVEVKRFVTAYRQKFNEAPEITAAHGYDTMVLLAKVMRTSKTNGEILMRGLRQLRDFTCTTGKIFSFNENGDPTKSMALMRILNGSPTYISDIEPN